MNELSSAYSVRTLLATRERALINRPRVSSLLPKGVAYCCKKLYMSYSNLARTVAASGRQFCIGFFAAQDAKSFTGTGMYR
jgi:hypothetical protein